MRGSLRVGVSYWYLVAALVLALGCTAALWALTAREAGAQTTTPTERVLVFSKTAGFRHDSIPAGIAAVQRLGAENGFAVDATEDAGAFTDANLAQYDAVIWLSTTGDVLNDQQRAAQNEIAGMPARTQASCRTPSTPVGPSYRECSSP